MTPIDRSTLGGDEPHYQLTHDFLVPALREWLAAKQRETMSGRAELSLAERAALWGDRRGAEATAHDRRMVDHRSAHAPPPLEPVAT